jgi:hypothetical protein
MSDLDGPDKDKHNRNFSDLESQRSQLFNTDPLGPPKSEGTREALQKRREKNEMNLRLTNFKKSFTKVNGAIQTYNEKI